MFDVIYSYNDYELVHEREIESDGDRWHDYYSIRWKQEYLMSLSHSNVKYLDLKTFCLWVDLGLPDLGLCNKGFPVDKLMNILVERSLIKDS